MPARHAVLLTPSKSSRPAQLLFYKYNASVSPLPATLTSRPQHTENTATLSPFLAALTTSIPVSPVFATLTQTAGVSLHLFPFWNLTTRHLFTPIRSGPFATTSLFSYSYELFCTAQVHNPFVFFQIQTLCGKHGGWGELCYLSSLFPALRLELLALGCTKAQTPPLYFQHLVRSSAPLGEGVGMLQRRKSGSRDPQSSRALVGFGQRVSEVVGMLPVGNNDVHRTGQALELPGPGIRHHRDRQMILAVRHRPRVLQDETPAAPLQGPFDALDRHIRPGAFHRGHSRQHLPLARPGEIAVELLLARHASQAGVCLIFWRLRHQLNFKGPSSMQGPGGVFLTGAGILRMGRRNHAKPKRKGQAQTHKAAKHSSACSPLPRKVAEASLDPRASHRRGLEWILHG